jgi:hypothetical protein
MVDIRSQRAALASPPLFKRNDTVGNSFTRFITACAVASVRRTLPYEVAAALWPADRDVIELTRAASAPAMVSVTGWAAELAHKVVTDALATLAPAAAAAEIMQRGLVLNFNGAGALIAPGFTAGAGNASFVAEGVPIPVRQLASTAATLNPHKLAVIAALTRELIESSNAEAAITDALVHCAGAALDAVFFDANPEDASRPAGLKNGIAALTASAATDTFEAVFEDISTLISAVATVGGSGPYIIVASPGRAIGLSLRASDAATSLTVLGSTALGNDICAIAPVALVTAASPTPDVESVPAATLVMDTAPGPAGTMGTEKSMFQTNSMAIKIRWPVAWALRSPAGFAWLTPTWK